MPHPNTFTYVYCHRVRFVAELSEFVRFLSVSVQPQHTEDVRNCAARLANYLSKIGIDNIQVILTPGRPIATDAGCVCCSRIGWVST